MNIRGPLIFSAGIVVGYGIAMRNQEPNGEIKAATATFIRDMRGILVDSWLDVKNDMAKKKKDEE